MSAAAKSSSDRPMGKVDFGVKLAKGKTAEKKIEKKKRIHVDLKDTPIEEKEGPKKLELELDVSLKHIASDEEEAAPTEKKPEDKKVTPKKDEPEAPKNDKVVKKPKPKTENSAEEKPAEEKPAEEKEKKPKPKVKKVKKEAEKPVEVPESVPEKPQSTQEPKQEDPPKDPEPVVAAEPAVAPKADEPEPTVEKPEPVEPSELPPESVAEPQPENPKEEPPPQVSEPPKETLPEPTPAPVEETPKPKEKPDQTSHLYAPRPTEGRQASAEPKPRDTDRFTYTAPPKRPVSAVYVPRVKVDKSEAAAKPVLMQYLLRDNDVLRDFDMYVQNSSFSNIQLEMDKLKITQWEKRKKKQPSGARTPRSRSAQPRCMQV